MANKRVIDLSTLSETVQEGQYILVDSSGGTGKMDLKKIVDDSTETLADQVEQNTQDIENLSGDLETLEGRVDDAEEAITGKADDDGIYPELYAGNLISDKMQEDKTPYLFRKTGGTLSGIGERCYDTIIGASVVENQLVPISSTSISTTIQGVTFVDNRDGSYTFYTGENGASANATFRIISKIDGGSPQHVHYLKGNAEGSSISTWHLADQYNGVFNYNFKKENIVKVLTDTPARLDLRVVVASGTVISVPVTIKPQVIDLTAELGYTIADYIYSLESATAGSGIAKLREWGFLRGYQAYNGGSIESVEVTGKVVRGFNQWDEEWEVGRINENTGENYNSGTQIRSKNFIPILPNTKYYFRYTISGNSARIAYYDANKSYLSMTSWIYSAVFTTPSNARYMKFFIAPIYGTTYNHDICINLSNPDRNGEYEAYAEQSYDYGNDTLRGIFKLDANNNLYADGDVKTSDGTITRYYGTRAYQSGDESLADAITDGTTTVYKLTTPTTEQGDPFPSPQVCYPDGTEEFITENGVPVGHSTDYPYSIKALAEELIDIPDVPTASGTYVLKATRSASGITYAWVTG